MAESAEDDDFVTEYIGELILEPTTLSRDEISRYLGRGYLFQINETFSVDGIKAGNESRFINHSSEPNCHARIRLVNGEHRIGIFAHQRIEPGDEIFLNYGKKFFDVPENESGSESESEQERERHRNR